jgi:hypothetical protein
MISMHDAPFVQMARERNLPLLTSDAKPCNAAGPVVTTETPPLPSQGGDLMGSPARQPHVRVLESLVVAADE